MSRKSLHLEKLERRALLAGVVSADLVGRELQIVGDELDNGVQVERAGRNAVRIVPDETTSVNDGRPGEPVVIRGTARSVNVELGDGNDQIKFSRPPRAPQSLKINTGAGNDTIDGAGGKDNIKGGDGDDDIQGGEGNDKIDGGNGDDIVDGGEGNDKVKGGKGADTFIYNGGKDKFRDFKAGEDILHNDGDLGKGVTPPEHWPSHRGHEELGVAVIEQLCQRLRVPSDYKQLAILCSRYHTHIHRARHQTGATLSKVLQSCDAYRRPQRFQQLLLACEADFRGRTGWEDKPYPQREFWQQAYTQANQVDVKQLVAAGYQGPAISEQLQQRRSQQLEQLRQQHTQQQ